MAAAVTRRGLLAGAAGLAAAGAAAGSLAGCSAAAVPPPGRPDRRSGESVTLTFWSWVPGIKAAVDLWNKRRPDVHVQLDNIVPGGNGGYARIDAAVRAGGAPDLAQIEYQQLPAFMLDGGLLDLTPYGVGEHEHLFVPWQWRQGVFDGRVRSVPQASGPMGMFYRADLLHKWGIDVPVTWDDYRAAARKVRKADPGAYIMAFPPGNSAYQTALAWQAGAHWFAADGDTWIIDLTDPDTTRMCDYWDGMLADRLVIAEQDQQNGWFAQVQQGKIVTWVGPQWGDALLIGNAAGTAGKWRVASMPQWDPAHPAAANWGGSSTAIMQDTRHPYEAIEFAIWLNTNLDSVDLLIAGGYGWPALAGAYDHTVLRKPSAFFGGQRYNAVFDKADGEIDTSWMWLPTQSAAFDRLDDAITSAVTGGGKLIDALRTAQGQIIDDLRAKGLKARAG
jgi:multiple sugar transport system substrate-binding protein